MAYIHQKFLVLTSAFQCDLQQHLSDVQVKCMHYMQPWEAAALEGKRMVPQMHIRQDQDLRDFTQSQLAPAKAHVFTKSQQGLNANSACPA